MARKRAGAGESHDQTPDRRERCSSTLERAVVDEIERYNHRKSTSNENGDRECARIADAIGRADGVKARAARDLGMGRTTLYRKLGATAGSALPPPEKLRPDT